MASRFSFLGLVNPSLGGGPNLRAENIFGVPGSVQPSQYYDPGIGNPAVSTSDYYHVDGLYGDYCDLTQMGAKGQTIAAERGRYFWVFTPDHPRAGVGVGWSDGQDIMGGYSDQPSIPPAKLDVLFRYDNSILRGGTENWGLYQRPQIIYNADDPDGKPFYASLEGQVLGGTPASPHSGQTQHEQGMARSDDLITWEVFGPTHFNDVFLDWSSFQWIKKVDADEWCSVGLSTLNNNYGGVGKWTSTDGLEFTQASNQLADVVGNSFFVYFAATELINIDGQDYRLAKEDEFDIPPYSGNTSAGTPTAGAVRIGQYVALVPVDEDFNCLSSPATIRISSRHAGAYPGPSYLQSVFGHLEDGVLHVYAVRGYFPSAQIDSLVQGAPYSDGGGLWQQCLDYYTYIVDAAAAAQATPCGVRASCDGGTVSLSWYDALPNRTYRVYRGTSAGSQATLIGDVSGVSATDTPTPDSQYWYKVVTMEGATERGHRVVRVYASANSELTNNHIDRILADDVTAYDVTKIEEAYDLLESEGLTSSLLFWANPAFGVKHTSNEIEKIYCLGTTRLPRGGDYTPATPSKTTYSATGMNGAAPGWTNAADGHGYFGGGRHNNIRRKKRITVIAAYKKANSNQGALLSFSQTGGRIPFYMALLHTAGTPGEVQFILGDGVAGTLFTANKAPAGATETIIAAGVFDGDAVTAYVEGEAGSPTTGMNPNDDFANPATLRGIWQGPDHYFLGSGASSGTFSYGTGYTFDNDQAQFSGSDLIVLEKDATAGQIAAFTTLIRGWIRA